MTTLTERQQTILAFIQACADDDELPPTVREIVDATGITSTSVVNYNLDALEAAGHITRRGQLARGIRLKAGSRGSGLGSPQGGLPRAGKGKPETRNPNPCLEAVRLHEVKIADLQQEVERLGRIVEGLR